MGLIGLIGLIGLVGFFVSRGLEKKVDGLKKQTGGENSKFESKLAENEKNISEIQKDLGQINIALRNLMTASDEQNKFSRQMKVQLPEIEQKVSAALSKVEGLENKIPAADLENFKNSLKTFQNKIDELQNADKKFDSRLKILETDKPSDSSDVLEKKISVLEGRIIEQNNILQQFQNYFSQVQTNFNNLQKKNDEQAKIIENHERRIKKLESPTPPPPPSPTPPDIRKFHIKNLNKPLFSKNPSGAKSSISIIENLSGITSFLETSDYDKKENFIRLIKNYRQNLQKFVDNLNRGKFDEDNFSEEATDAFFDTLSKYFLATLPVAIYRGGRENPKFYSELLAQVNAYLAACHVYTELIEPKKLMNHDDVEKMNIIKKDTAAKNEDKIIDEVERLPYFLDYLTKDNETEHFCFEGKMVVFKFDGGKK